MRRRAWFDGRHWREDGREMVGRGSPSRALRVLRESVGVDRCVYEVGLVEILARHERRRLGCARAKRECTGVVCLAWVGVDPPSLTLPGSSVLPASLGIDARALSSCRCRLRVACWARPKRAAAGRSRSSRPTAAGRGRSMQAAWAGEAAMDLNPSNTQEESDVSVYPDLSEEQEQKASVP